MHVGALRAWNSRPVGIKLVLEGQEEIRRAHDVPRPGNFAADAMVIGDMGSLGERTLLIGLRGTAGVIVGVGTLAGPKHSGQFGSAAPDALVTLLHALASLHDERGDVAVPGLRREEWTGASYSEEEFRELAEVEPGLPFVGTGGLGERLWSGPAITVTGVDAQPVAQALNAVVPYARAKLNLRIHPEQDPEEAQAILIEHLEDATVRDPTGGRGGRDRQGLLREDVGPRGGGAGRPRDRLEAGGGRSDRRVDPARERARRGGSRRRDSAARHGRQVRQRRRPNERVLLDEFEGRDRRSRSSSASTRRSGRGERRSGRARSAPSPTGCSAASRRSGTRCPTRRSSSRASVSS